MRRLTDMLMKDIRFAIRQLINSSDEELDGLLVDYRDIRLPKKGILLQPDQPVDFIYFIQSGWLRVVIPDLKGREHTIHFSKAGDFITDYASFLLRQVAQHRLEALEPLQLIAIPRSRIAWGYANMAEGDRLGRLIAEQYFIYQDQRLRSLYSLSPKERYDSIEDYFPGIHNKVPQHMIASYLGITPVHLSRLKKAAIA